MPAYLVLLRVEIARFTLGGSGALRRPQPLNAASNSGSLHRACFAYPNSSLLL